MAAPSASQVKDEVRASRRKALNVCVCVCARSFQSACAISPRGLGKLTQDTSAVGPIVPATPKASAACCSPKAYSQDRQPEESELTETLLALRCSPPPQTPIKLKNVAAFTTRKPRF